MHCGGIDVKGWEFAVQLMTQNDLTNKSYCDRLCTLCMDMYVIQVHKVFCHMYIVILVIQSFVMTFWLCPKASMTFVLNMRGGLFVRVPTSEINKTVAFAFGFNKNFTPNNTYHQKYSWFIISFNINSSIRLMKYCLYSVDSKLLQIAVLILKQINCPDDTQHVTVRTHNVWVFDGEPCLRTRYKFFCINY